MRTWIRIAAWLMKATAWLALTTAGFQLIDGHFWIAIPLVVAGFAMILGGSMLHTGPGTGAVTARYMMEVNNELQMVKPPGKNVLDPIDPHDTRSRGR
jgi:Trk-type K+ transport system membrane component